MTTLLLPRSAGRLVCPAQARCVVVAPVLRRAGRATHSARCSAMPDSEQLQVAISGRACPSGRLEYRDRAMCLHRCLKSEHA